MAQVKFSVIALPNIANVENGRLVDNQPTVFVICRLATVLL